MIIFVVLAGVLAIALTTAVGGKAGRALVVARNISSLIAIYGRSLRRRGACTAPRMFGADDVAVLARVLDTGERVWLAAGLAFFAGTGLQSAAAT